jgi:hypothetical protein
MFGPVLGKKVIECLISFEEHEKYLDDLNESSLQYKFLHRLADPIRVLLIFSLHVPCLFKYSQFCTCTDILSALVSSSFDSGILAS